MLTAESHSHAASRSFAGDLDFFELHSITYPLDDVQELLTSALHQAPSSKVDSLCVAGLLDLHRTKGVWCASVRYGWMYGGLAGLGKCGSDDVVPLSKEQLTMLSTPLRGSNHCQYRSQLRLPPQK